MIKLKSIKGFSVIELLIVIAIIAIVTVIAVPSFTKYRYNAGLREAAEGITAEIQRYKQKSVAEHTRYLFYFPSWSDNKKYYIYSHTPDCMDSCQTNWCLVWPPITRNISDNNNVIISLTPSFNNTKCYSGAAYFEILPRGITGSGTLELKHLKTNSTAEIKLNMTGQTWVVYDMK